MVINVISRLRAKQFASCAKAVAYTIESVAFSIDN